MACLGPSYKTLNEFKVCIIAALEWWKQDELPISKVCKYCEYDKKYAFIIVTQLGGHDLHLLAKTVLWKVT